MNQNNFFQQIEQLNIFYKDYSLKIPIFYQEMEFMSVLLLASIEKIKKILPSSKINPYRITPWHTTILITTYQYKQSDIGSYNEVIISIPISINEAMPLFIGSLRKAPKTPMLYLHSVPVNSEVARFLGIEIAGYSKFLADINYIEEPEWLSCEVKVDNQLILRLRGRKLKTKKIPRSYVNPISYRNGLLLRSELVISQRGMGISQANESVDLVLGQHPLAEELKQLNLGRILQYQYCPSAQAILITPFESFSR